MENEDETFEVQQGTPPPPASLETHRSKVGKNGKKGAPLSLRTGQVPVKKHPAPARLVPTATPSPSPSSTNVSVEIVQEDEEEDNSSYINDELSISISSGDGGNLGDNGDEATEAKKGKRGVKRVKGGISVSPSKCKVKRAKRADCWKYFKEIQVASKKEAGVMVTKAKCKFC